MIYLHKILPVGALPIGLTILLVAAGLLLRRHGLCWLGLALLWVACRPLTGDAASISGPVILASSAFHMRRVAGLFWLQKGALQ